jgi:Na+-translocating ferredoxin:NAD+ oxidoreductase subunit C
MFRGGIHTDCCKLTANKPIEKSIIPSKIILPVSQHIGVPCEILVKKGDLVKKGQLVASSNVSCSAPIHSSISGVVDSIQELPHPITGKLVKSILIKSDGKDELHDSIYETSKEKDYLSYSPEKLLEIIKNAGIVGLGGAAFPTHVKLSPPENIKINTLIINGAECEPYLTSDHRLMIERAEDIVKGIEIVNQILKPQKTIIGIENNKKKAISALKKAQLDNNMEIIDLPVKYPQGAEKMLIYSLTGKKVPAGGLPMDVGCVVQNIGTIIAIYEAVAFSKPLYERVVTITGKVKTPKNILARTGTPISELIDMADGYRGEPKKLINGGPMMGIAMPSDDLPIIKGTSGIVVFNEKDLFKSNTPIECIRCGRCVKECPMFLNPSLIAKYAEKGRIDLSEKMFAMDCIECGCCSFGCPSKIDLVHWIRCAKNEISKLRRINPDMKMCKR